MKSKIEKEELPAFPCTADVWDRLAAERRPIVLYGMGNGADKFIKKLATLGKAVADVFASDAFVRGQSYAGIRVKTLAEIERLYPDCLIAVVFGSHLPEVIAQIGAVAACHDLIIPDLPVAGEEYFDKDHFNGHYEEIRRAYDMLADDLSRATFASLVRYKLSGAFSDLMAHTVTTDALYSALETEKIEYALDLGAYTGDTAREMIRYFPNLRRIFAVEPDARSFRKLSAFAEAAPVPVTPVRGAAWSEDGEGIFFGSANRNSSLSPTSHEKREESIPLVTPDGVIGESRVDYVKYDVEGAEREAILGTKSTIRRDQPTLLVSAYHRSEDLYSLISLINSIDPTYTFTMRRTPAIPAWEIALIATARTVKDKDGIHETT